MRAETLEALLPDDRFDFSDETPTEPGNESMEQIMGSMADDEPDPEDTVRSPGIPTLTSERPTRPIRRPIVRWREDP